MLNRITGLLDSLQLNNKEEGMRARYLSLIGLAACVRTGPALLAALDETNSLGSATYIECDSGCVVPWQRAQVWLAHHSKMKVQTATDVLLETYNPARSGLGEVGFSVTKEPAQTAGAYRLNVRAVCSGSFGCAPTEAEATRALLYYAKTGKDVLDRPGLLGAGASLD